MESIEPHEDQEIILWDSERKGRVVRIYPSSRRTYFVQHRNKLGRSHRVTLGVHGVITAEEARNTAKTILGDVARKDDPASEKKKLRNAIK